MKKALYSSPYTQKAALAFGLFAFVVIPVLFTSLVVNGISEKELGDYPNSQTVAVLTPSRSATFSEGVGGGDIVTEDGALVANSGPSGTAADQIYTPTSDQISLYMVREGDTLGHIGELFDVSPNTIRWANDLGIKDTIRPGQVLTILPISSVQHTVKSGDTLASIVKKYDGDLTETAVFNGLSENAKLAVGETILVPGGIVETDTADHNHTAPAPTQKKTESKTASKVTTDGYFQRSWGGRVSQRYHGQYRGVDYAMPNGSPIGAAAAGTIISSKQANWNGGYGGMVVIQHDNGLQTLYAHLTRPEVSVGQRVAQGQIIGLSGNTGRSTGPHLHFEIRGGLEVPSYMMQ